jgi:hypothetical protein
MISIVSLKSADLPVSFAKHADRLPQKESTVSKRFVSSAMVKGMAALSVFQAAFTRAYPCTDALRSRT